MKVSNRVLRSTAASASSCSLLRRLGFVAKDAGRGSFFGCTGERGVPVLRVERVDILEIAEVSDRTDRTWLICGVVILPKGRASESDPARFRDCAVTESGSSSVGCSSEEAEDLFEKERLSLMTGDLLARWSKTFKPWKKSAT
mmetsp:Transcript_48593/g.98871  ORF Transcript_48593/g.98871 Transcript_48593/m.98871 type:complete len:143 (-) Transcript_48593:5-433(-)